MAPKKKATPKPKAAARKAAPKKPLPASEGMVTEPEGTPVAQPLQDREPSLSRHETQRQASTDTVCPDPPKVKQEQQEEPIPKKEASKVLGKLKCIGEKHNNT